MKTFKNIFLGLGVAATLCGGLASCVGDLDLQPRDPSSITDVSKDIDRVFADIYLNFSTYGANGSSPVSGFDGGMTAFQRAMFIAEEIPTDEACWLWDPADYGTMNYGLFNANQGALYGFYSRLIINITLCNQFIQSVDNGTFILPDEEAQKKAANYKRQAKTLWGACYYYMLSFYDKIPYADFTTPVGAVPEQLSRQEVYNRVTTLLEEVVADYKANNELVPVYGYVGLDAAEAILAKIYLNAQTWTGTAAYDKCYTHCDAIIKRLGKGGYYGNGLARSYNTLFGANNDEYVLGNKKNQVNEIIWSIVGNEVNLTSFSGSAFLQAGWIGTNGVQVTMYCPTQDQALDGTYADTDNGQIVYKYYADATAFADAKATYDSTEGKDAWQKYVNEVINDVPYSFDPTQTGYVAQDWYNAGYGWKCMVARKSFVRKFEWDDVNMSVSSDRRVSLWQTSKHGFSVENISLVGDDWGKNGYLTPKYSNWAYNDDGTINRDASPTNIRTAAGDYAVIRLAEIYLTAAEAILNGGGGTQAEALQYVNWIRERAYADAPGSTDHHWTSLSMQDLRDERCRELYQENVRRTDLIRWNQWTTGYTWEWKGGTQSGTNLPENSKLYPIPNRVMTASSFQQTTGY